MRLDRKIKKFRRPKNKFILPVVSQLCHNRVGPACFVLPGKPQTYRPPRFHGKQVYAPHSKTMNKARQLLESAWKSEGFTYPFEDTPLRVVVRAYTVFVFR